MDILLNALSKLLFWCPDIIGFLRHSPRYWQATRQMRRRNQLRGLAR